MDLLVRNFIFNWRAEGKQSVLTKFGLEKKKIEMTEDSSNIAKALSFKTLSIFPFLDPYMRGYQL